MPQQKNPNKPDSRDPRQEQARPGQGQQQRNPQQSGQQRHEQQREQGEKGGQGQTGREPERPLESDEELDENM